MMTGIATIGMINPGHFSDEITNTTGGFDLSLDSGSDEIDEGFTGISA